MGAPTQGRCGEQSDRGLSRVEQPRDLLQGLPPFSRRAQPPPVSLRDTGTPACVLWHRHRRCRLLHSQEWLCYQTGGAATKILVQIHAKAPRLSATPCREFQAIRLVVSLPYRKLRHSADTRLRGEGRSTLIAKCLPIRAKSQLRVPPDQRGAQNCASNSASLRQLG